MRLFLEGFENGNLDAWEETTNVDVISSQGHGMSGNYIAEFSSDLGNKITKFIPLSTELNVNFRWKLKSYDDGMIRFLSFINWVTFQSYFVMTSLGFYQGKFYIYNWLDSYIYNGDVFEYDVGVPYRISVYYYPRNDATGKVIIKLDDVVRLDYTGNNVGTTKSGVDAIRFGWNSGSEDNSYYIDDIIVDNTSEIPSKNRVLGMTYEVNSNEFNNSEGTVTECISEDDDKYIQTAEAGTRIALNIPSNQMEIVKSIHSIQPQILGQRVGNLGLKVGFNDGIDDIFETSKIYPGWRSDNVSLLTETLSASGDYFNDKTIYIETE